MLLVFLPVNYGLQNGFHPIVPRLPRPFPRPNRRKYSLSHVCVGSSTMAKIVKFCPKIMRPLFVVQYRKWVEHSIPTVGLADTFVAVKLNFMDLEDKKWELNFWII